MCGRRCALILPVHLSRPTRSVPAAATAATSPDGSGAGEKPPRRRLPLRGLDPRSPHRNRHSAAPGRAVTSTGEQVQPACSSRAVPPAPAGCRRLRPILPASPGTNRLRAQRPTPTSPRGPRRRPSRYLIGSTGGQHRPVHPNQGAGGDCGTPPAPRLVHHVGLGAGSELVGHPRRCRRRGVTSRRPSGCRVLQRREQPAARPPTPSGSSDLTRRGRRPADHRADRPRCRRLQPPRSPRRRLGRPRRHQAPSQPTNPRRRRPEVVHRYQEALSGTPPDMSHGNADNGVTTPRSTFYDQGRFGRLFPTLPPFAADTPLIRDALAELGANGGPMDADDDLSDPITLITDPAKSVNNPNNPTMTAGFTFLGQFLDHDMTFDPTSSLARRQDPESIRNFRIPALDLDSVYGGGPGGIAAPLRPDRRRRPDDAAGRGDPRVGGACRSTARPAFDLPRNSQNVALIGDPRNDENLIVSQFHLALLRLPQPGRRRRQGRARRRLHRRGDLRRGAAGRPLALPVAGPPRVPAEDRRQRRLADDVLTNGPQHFTWRNDPYIPVEFSVAAYRFGHSQVRPSYRGNFGTSADRPDPAVLRPDLRPGDRRPDRPGRPARRPAGAAPVHRLADVLRLRRRPGAAEQEDRHHAVDASCSSCMGQPPGEPGLAGHPQPAAQPHHEGAVGPAGRQGHAAAGAGAGDLADLTPFHLDEPHAAVVLRPARGTGDGRRRAPRPRRRPDRRPRSSSG